MEKRREIPAAQTKNSAPRADVERVLALLDRLGFGTENAFVEKLGRSRATFYRLKKHDVTVSMLREVEEHLVREAQSRNENVAPTRTERDALLEEWRALGEELLVADPGRFSATLDGLRDMVESTQLQQRAIPEWLELGRRLMAAGPDKFDEVLRGLREVVEAQETIARFDHQLFLRGRPRKRYEA